ncbi:MAG: transposase [Rhodospirillales bacterium]|nr:transposase [Rhodospirillales bacterium]
MTHQVLTYKYKLLPSKSQRAALKEVLEEQRVLYNAALQERIDCYQKTGKNLTFFDQTKSATVWRKESESELPVNLHRWTLKRLDTAFQSFFKRVKKRDGKAGFPRFRGRNWKSFGFAEFVGIRLIGKRLKVKGFRSGIKIHMHRSMPKDADIISCSFTKVNNNWFVSLQIKTEVPDIHEPQNAAGIDLGLKQFATLHNGTTIAFPRYSRKAEKELRKKQRALSRCKEGSRRRQKVKRGVAAIHAKIANSRSTHLHQIAASLVKTYDGFALENLNVKGLMKSNLSRSIGDAGWSMFKNILRYKAARAGLQYKEVDPRNTSQLCSGCGVIVKKTLQDRIHKCDDCGLILDRDVNAGRNILLRSGFKGVLVLEKPNVEQRLKHASMNLRLEEISN